MLLLPKKRWVLLTYLAILIVFAIPNDIVWAEDKSPHMDLPKGTQSSPCDCGCDGMYDALVGAFVGEPPQDVFPQIIIDMGGQTKLKDLGYLSKDFPVDGKETETLNEAVKKFQETYALPPDDATALDEKIQEVAHNENRIREINQQNPDTLFLKVEHPVGHASQYIVMFGQGMPIKTDNISKLVSQINSRLSESHHTPAAIYFDFPGVSPNKAEAFGRSYRIQQKLQNSITNIPVMTLPRDKKFQNILFSHQVRLLSKQEDTTITRMNSGSFKGWFETQVNFIVTVGNKSYKIILFVYTKTEEAAKKVMQVLYNVKGNLSLAMQTAKVYQEIAQNSHGYVLTAKWREQLRKTGIPMETLDKLGPLEDKTFETRTKFKKTVKEAIGDDPNLDKIINYGEIRPEDVIRFQFQLESKRIDLGHLFRWLWVGYQFS